MFDKKEGEAITDAVAMYAAKDIVPGYTMEKPVINQMLKVLLRLARR